MREGKYLLLLLVVLLFPVLCFAENKILINEFLIDPQPQSVEIFNTGDQAIDLSGWVIDDNGSSSGTYTIAAGTVIQPNSCLVFSKDFNLNKSSSDSARLFDSGMSLVDSHSYKSSPGSNVSFARIPDFGDWSTASASLGYFNSTNTSCVTTPTPTDEAVPTTTPSPTIEPSPTASPISYDNVYINEAMVNPGKDNDEWVEIFNDNDFTVNLIDWHIDDIENAGSAAKKFSAEISPKGYRVVVVGSSLFNNDGDSVRLLDFDKNLKDSFEYGKSTEKKTYGRISLEENEFCLQEESYEKTNNSCLAVASPPTLIPSAVVTITPPRSNATVQKKSRNPVTPAITGRAKKIEEKERTDSYEEILGAEDYRPKNYNILIKHLSILSFSYSLLTVVSVLIKMTSIYAKRRFVFPPHVRPTRRQ